MQGRSQRSNGEPEPTKLFAEWKVSNKRTKGRKKMKPPNELRSNPPIQDCGSFSELLARRRMDFPQAIAAGWMLPDGQPVAACAVACERQPTAGELAVAWAGCVAAALRKIDELCAEHPAEYREQLMGLVMQMVGDLEVVKRMKSEGIRRGTRVNKLTRSSSRSDRRSSAVGFLRVFVVNLWFRLRLTARTRCSGRRAA
jgi:hypothetical protein